MVSYSEVCADWISEEIRLPVSHTFMPSNALVTKTVVEKLKGEGGRMKDEGDVR